MVSQIDHQRTQIKSNTPEEGDVPDSCSSLRHVGEGQAEMENVDKQPDRFGKMTYLLHKGAEFKDDQSNYGCGSLAGIIQLQQSRKMDNKTWRPMQERDLGDLREPDSVVSGASLHIHDTEDTDDTAAGSLIQHPFDRTHISPSTTSHALSIWDRLGGMYNGTGTGKDPTLAQADKQGSHRSETHCMIAEPYGQLFGNLPDPIRLHEQMGEFDGQVVFIGHPNRDISAHQWSSSSFQWVNIGRYVHSCSKVEGSLASDRLRYIDEPCDALAYFKMAAEHRETLIIQNGRPKDHSSIVEHDLHAGTTAVPIHSYADASIEVSRVSASTQSESQLSLPLTMRTSFGKDVLEDPFVAGANASVTRSKNDGHMQGDLIAATGSLDLTYRFPTSATTTTRRSNIEASAFDRKSTQSQNLNLSSAPALFKVALGEEAASQRGVTCAVSEGFQGLLSSAPPKSVSSPARFRNEVEASHTTSALQDGVAQSTLSFHSRPHHALPTLSVTPPTYVASKLSATAALYARIQTAATGSGGSESSGSTMNAPAVGLHYSDPDGLQRRQTYEVTNGLGQQAPTRQKFKGPFFTEMKPTTHDLTVALSVHISEEEKLKKWFHDGHRAARQREYTKSLIAGAVAASSRGQLFGAIGEWYRGQAGGRYANTGPFVRLYENLSEYVEEYGQGGGQSYFTRGWKPGGWHVRGMGPDDNRSFFHQERAAPHLWGGRLLRPSGCRWE